MELERLLGRFRELTPPFVWHLAGRALSRVYGFHGDYRSFEEAMAECEKGYQDPGIGASVLARTLRDIDSQAGGPLVLDSRSGRLGSALLTAMAGSPREPFRVLDVGGACGHHYFTFKRLVPAARLQWDVLETAAMVSAGGSLHERFPDLAFFSDPAGLDGRLHDVVMASSSLQYLPEPMSFLTWVLERRPSFVVLDRLSLIESDRHRLTVQTVAPWVHASTYPAWFLARRSLEELWERHGYSLVCRWLVPEDAPFLDGRRVCYQGLVLRSPSPRR